MTNQRPFGAKRTFKLWLMILVVAVVGPASPAPRAISSSVEPEKQVRDFIEAFNARDLDVMLALADENVQWLSVDGAKVSAPLNNFD